MPDLIGIDGERAAEFLQGTRDSASRWWAIIRIRACPAGIVIRQTPAGGFQIAPGEAISLEVSR